MKLAASCLAWRPEETPGAAALLRHHGATGVEIVPTALWGSWDVALAATALPPDLEGFLVPSMQSLLFGLEGHCLFADPASEERLVAHLKRVVRLAGRLGCRVLVFGSPRQRLRGAMDMPGAVRAFGNFAARIAPEAAAEGVVLCLEANPVSYGCDFVTGTLELVELIARIRQPGIGLHFDTGTAIVNGEDLAGLIRRIGPELDHLHVSAPGLAPVRANEAIHASIAEALDATGYAHWVSIEMLRGPSGLADLDAALGAVRRLYLSVN